MADLVTESAVSWCQLWYLSSISVKHNKVHNVICNGTACYIFKKYISKIRKISYETHWENCPWSNTAELYLQQYQNHQDYFSSSWILTRTYRIQNSAEVTLLGKKTLLLVHNALKGFGHQCISELRSQTWAGWDLLTVPRIRCQLRALSVIWRKLPADPRSVTSVFTVQKI